MHALRPQLDHLLVLDIPTRGCAACCAPFRLHFRGQVDCFPPCFCFLFLLAPLGEPGESPPVLALPEHGAPQGRCWACPRAGLPHSCLHSHARPHRCTAMSPSHHLVRPERAGQTRGPRGILKRCAICVSLWSRTSQTTAGTLCYVADIQPGGSAALQGGVEIGDKILAIDRQSVAGLSLADVGARMGGPEGSYVILGLIRTTSVLFGPDTEEHVEVSICRGRRARGGGGHEGGWRRSTCAALFCRYATPVADDCGGTHATGVG